MKNFLLTLSILWVMALAWCHKEVNEPINWEDVQEWWWERITVVTEMCEEEWWKVEEWQEWWDIQNVCFYPDESFCYLEELASDDCHKWDMTYYDEDVSE